MSEIPSLADSYWLKWFIVGVIGIISSLTIYIFRAIKKDIEEIKKEQKKDHDKLIKLKAEHDSFHGKNGNNHDSQ